MYSKMIEKPTPTKFPVLMESKSDGTVVLFESTSKGTVVYELRPNYKIGTYRSDWVMRMFAPIVGQVILSNDDF